MKQFDFNDKTFNVLDKVPGDFGNKDNLLLLRSRASKDFKERI